jgi:hypothetical protein
MLRIFIASLFTKNKKYSEASRIQGAIGDAPENLGGWTYWGT